MTWERRLAGVGLGMLLVLHGLGHAVLPLRAADIVAPGAMAPAMTALYVVALFGFVAAGLGVLGVRPLTRVVPQVVLAAGLAGLAAHAWFRQTDLWPGVLLSVVLPLFAVVHVETMPAGWGTRPRAVWKRVADVAAIACLGWVVATATLWPWHRSWGTASYEWSLRLPGDRVPRTPQFEILHAVTIDAPPSAVWPWLVQLGQDRAGFYSYDWLERAFGVQIHNAREIRPDWQQRAAGDRVYATQANYLGGVFGVRPGWTVVRVEPPEALVLENWGAFVLLPTPDGRTRFLIRSTISNGRSPVWGAALNLTAFALPHFIMQRKMMLTIKALAEQGRQARR